MPAMKAAIALLLGGCFAPEPPVGAPCGPATDGERCPEGLICIESPGGTETCEAMGDGPLPGDRDADGFPDLLDNCPDDRNADQADEDADGKGDVCDPCPPFPGDEDADGDGVADACDPNPSTPGDAIVAFNGFFSLPPGWEASGFIIAAGQGIAMTNNDSTSHVTFASPSTGRVEVRSQAQLLQITADDPNLGAFSIVEQYVPATDKGVACQLSSLANGMQQQLRIFNLDTRTVVDTAGHVFESGSAIDLRLRRTDDTYSCRAQAPVPRARRGCRVHGAGYTHRPPRPWREHDRPVGHGRRESVTSPGGCETAIANVRARCYLFRMRHSMHHHG